MANIISNGEILIFSLDKDIGCLGFFDPNIAFLAFVPFGILSSVMGSAGYVMSLVFYSPAVVTNSYLLEPFIAQMMGYYFHIDAKPGCMTVVGTVITLYGVYKID